MLQLAKLPAMRKRLGTSCCPANTLLASTGRIAVLTRLLCRTAPHRTAPHRTARVAPLLQRRPRLMDAQLLLSRACLPFGTTQPALEAPGAGKGGHPHLHPHTRLHRAFRLQALRSSRLHLPPAAYCLCLPAALHGPASISGISFCTAGRRAAEGRNALVSGCLDAQHKRVTLV